MVQFGYFASLEEFTPTECLQQVTMAESTGFDSVWVNDHFHPWFDHHSDGTLANGGNCWSWLPAALERTDEIQMGTGVTAIQNRYHPANVAHQLATLLEMYPNRVDLGLGTGEALNEVPLGYEYPSYTERARRTVEAVRVIRMLFEDDFVTHEGNFWSLNDANLYTKPEHPPSIHIAASGPTSAKMAGHFGDGFITVFQKPETITNELLPAVEAGLERSNRHSSLKNLKKSIHIHCSYADSLEEATETCKPWRLTLLPMVFEYGIADPRYLQDHGDLVDIDELRNAFLISSDSQDYIDATATYIDCGFDNIVFQSSSPDQERFCEMMATEVFPSFS